jgi:hypothetical protein
LVIIFFCLTIRLSWTNEKLPRLASFSGVHFAMRRQWSLKTCEWWCVVQGHVANAQYGDTMCFNRVFPWVAQKQKNQKLLILKNSFWFFCFCATHGKTRLKHIVSPYCAFATWPCTTHHHSHVLSDHCLLIAKCTPLKEANRGSFSFVQLRRIVKQKKIITKKL